MTAQQLPLDQTAMPPMREAYIKCGLAKHGISYETATTAPHLAIPLRNVAAAIAKTRSTE